MATLISSEPTASSAAHQHMYIMGVGEERARLTGFSFYMLENVLVSWLFTSDGNLYQCVLAQRLLCLSDKYTQNFISKSSC